MLSIIRLFENKILTAMKQFPRENFLDIEIRHLAYSDKPLPIKHEQTTSAPSLIKIVLKAAKLNKNKIVLEVGTGSGWQTAIMASMCKHVYTIEINNHLLTKAKVRLNKSGITNISTKLGDGKKGWKEKSPFDVIIVSALVNSVPSLLFKQLSKNGYIIVPVRKGHNQQLIKMDKTTSITNLGSVKFVEIK